MEERPKRYSIISKYKDNFMLKLLLCIVLCSLIIIFFLIVNKILDVRISREYTIVDDIRFMNSIEKVTTEKDEIKLEGYAFILEKNSYDNMISVFLRNVVTENEIWFDMEQVDRVDVSSHFDSEHDYINSGFIASIDKRALSSEEIYEIIINIDYSDTNDKSKKAIRKTVSSNQYLLGGELYSYNPIEFDMPNMNIESELIKEVFTNGKLCFYQKEEGMYVYQYEGRLYWIATDDFKFDENDKTYIIYHLYTSQVNKLPEHRIQHKFDNLDFNFEKYEYMDENTAPYRVAIRNIPDEYVITYIYTGVYNMEIKKIYWKNRFHLE
ncbi:MAG: hypothetical protein GX225_03315 [Clostridiales bacterium]|nr:hypothetical protein [Clostridiales bacterium]